MCTTIRKIGAEARDPGVAGSGRRGLPQDDAAGTGERYEHVTGDGWIAECFELLVGPWPGL